MNTKKKIVRMFFVLLIVLLMSSTASARPLAVAPVTGFTYQGKLSDGGSPANGKYDFIFTLYDSLTDGIQMGDPFSLKEVPVISGLFTVQLDFGDVYDGKPLYLEITVRPGGSEEDFDTLSPRQQLTATPYAIYASKAPWNGLIGLPAGFADGVDNDTQYTAGDGLNLTGTQFSGKGSPYQNVVIVAKSGGDYTTITAALNSISDASASNPYLIYVAPGVYTDQVYMKEYVDIQGSGELTTKITFTGSTYDNASTLEGNNNAELRFLTVENTGGNAYAVAILNHVCSPKITNVTAIASGGTNTNYGVINSGVIDYATSSPSLTNVTASASGGNNNIGVFNDTDAYPTMTNVTVSASGGTNINYGVYNYVSSPTINNSIIRASGGANSYGIYNNYSTGIAIMVNNSQVSGGTNTIKDAPSYGCTTRIGASQLSGGAVSVSNGTVTCAGVYDENYVFYASTCP
jgi:hypothetical protein